MLCVGQPCVHHSIFLPAPFTTLFGVAACTWVKLSLFALWAQHICSLTLFVLCAHMKKLWQSSRYVILFSGKSAWYIDKMHNTIDYNTKQCRTGTKEWNSAIKSDLSCLFPVLPYCVLLCSSYPQHLIILIVDTCIQNKIIEMSTSK